jgi:hypothetical protein
MGGGTRDGWPAVPRLARRTALGSEKMLLPPKMSIGTVMRPSTTSTARTRQPEPQPAD